MKDKGHRKAVLIGAVTRREIETLERAYRAEARKARASVGLVNLGEVLANAEAESMHRLLNPVDKRAKAERIIAKRAARVPREMPRDVGQWQARVARLHKVAAGDGKLASGALKELLARVKW